MTARDRRALVIGAAVIGTAVLGLRVVPWAVRRAVTTRAELREQAGLLARGREEITAAPLLRDSAAVLMRALVGLAPQLLGGGTAAEASADLSARVNLAASHAPAKLERVEGLADSAAAGRLGQARVRAVLETDVRGLVAFLRAIEVGDLVLAVEDLSVVVPDPGSTDRVPEVLKVEVTVTGWYLKDGERGGRKRDS